MKQEKISKPHTLDHEKQHMYAQAFAFVGNSLLLPMSQTSSIGLSAQFWKAFPDFDSEDIACALDGLAQWAEENGVADPASAYNNDDSVNSYGDHNDLDTTDSGSVHAESDSITSVSVEFTHLFIGPPSPAAAPWETFYRDEGVTSGFGRATIEMKQALREAGLEVANKNNQYADHIGMELLYIAALCSKEACLTSENREFFSQHPASWIARLKKAIQNAAPEGYYHQIVGLAEALLSSLINEIE